MRKMHIRKLSASQGAKLFDRVARQYMNMSGDEFKRRYDCGEFRDIADDSRVARLVMLRPFSR